MTEREFIELRIQGLKLIAQGLSIQAEAFEKGPPDAVGDIRPEISSSYLNQAAGYEGLIERLQQMLRETT